MAIKITVELSKQHHLPECGCLGASCRVEFQEGELLLDDIDAFQQRVRAVFQACESAIDAQIAPRDTYSVC